MIELRASWEIEKLKAAGGIADGARRLAGSTIREGVTTGEIDRELRRFIKQRHAKPTFLNYNGFPKSVCISVNDEIIHGIPGSRKLMKGDIVSIDVGATFEGYVGDCAATFAVGDITEDAQRLIRVTRECFFEGLKFAKQGYRISDISGAVQAHAESYGYSLVREYTGHGVGRNLHEDPEVPNYVMKPRKGGDPRLLPGMVIAIEPMVNAGEAGITVLNDGWTVITTDGKLSAHYENTVLITRADPEILTRDYDNDFVI